MTKTTFTLDYYFAASDQEEFGLVGTTKSDLSIDEDHSPGLKYIRPPRRTSFKKTPNEAKSKSGDTVRRSSLGGP